MFFICSGINGCFGVIYLYLGEKDMKRLMFLGVFLLFCCGVVSSANAAVCCTINYGNGNEAATVELEACTDESMVVGACGQGVCDETTGSVLTCGDGLTKCCVYDAACGNTNNLKCSCTKSCSRKLCSPKSRWSWVNEDVEGCNRYVEQTCSTAWPANYNPTGVVAAAWGEERWKTEEGSYSCSKGCYLEGDECNKCPGDRTTDGDRNSGGLDSCKLDCDEGLGLTAEKDSCVCDSGWYGKNKTCEKCPDGFTSEKGMATTKAECFLSGTKYEDEKGWFETTSKCNYDVSRN